MHGLPLSSRTRPPSSPLLLAYIPRFARLGLGLQNAPNTIAQNVLRNSQRAPVAVRCPFRCTQLTIDTAYFFWQRVEDLSPHVNVCAPARSTLRRHLHYGLPHSPSKFHLRDSWKHFLHFQDLNIASGPPAFIFEFNSPWHRVILGSFFITSPCCFSSDSIA